MTLDLVKIGPGVVWNRKATIKVTISLRGNKRDNISRGNEDWIDNIYSV